mmetsp:Transcript_1647/g.2710  ORF Transcript_1647/g.2710 Transcript_1647/m.2710 type:complete len:267 (-) Transcript_1647:53-853(-)
METISSSNNNQNQNPPASDRRDEEINSLQLVYQEEGEFEWISQGEPRLFRITPKDFVTEPSKGAVHQPIVQFRVPSNYPELARPSVSISIPGMPNSLIQQVQQALNAKIAEKPVGQEILYTILMSLQTIVHQQEANVQILGGSNEGQIQEQNGENPKYGLRANQFREGCDFHICSDGPGGVAFFDFKGSFLRGNLTLLAVSFDGFGHCQLRRPISFRREDSERLKILFENSEDPSSQDQIHGVISAYMRANSSVLWEDALIQHRLI